MTPPAIPPRFAAAPSLPSAKTAPVPFPAGAVSLFRAHPPCAHVFPRLRFDWVDPESEYEWRHANKADGDLRAVPHMPRPSPNRFSGVRGG